MLLNKGTIKLKAAARRAEPKNSKFLQEVGSALTENAQIPAATAVSSLPAWTVWVIAGAVGLAGGVAGTLVRRKKKVMTLAMKLAALRRNTPPPREI